MGGERTLCALSALVAFVLGIIIGILIPFYVIKPSPSFTAASQHIYKTTTQPPPVRFLNSNLVQGIYWSDQVEQLLPKGFSDQAVAKWRKLCREQPVVKLEEGCGRMQNRLITFWNGTKSCSRYRQNYDQIQGEIFSFHLSRLLGIGNLPPATLALVRPRDKQWENVRAQLSLAQWAEDRPVVLTQYLEGLVPAYIPHPFRKKERRFHPPDVYIRGLHLNKSVEEVMELAQWSDLIVFDYLTANLDRIVNNLYNQQWNPAMMDSPAHNLAKQKETGHLIFLDNESGLLHGYRLLDKYESYHRTMLDSLCVFRRSTANAILNLKDKRNIGSSIKRGFLEAEEQFKDYLPMVPEKSIRILNNRIDRVSEQIRRCQELYE